MTTPSLMTNEVLRKTIALSERCPDAPFDAASGRELARDVLHLRDQRDDLHARNSELVEERRAAITERDEARELACREGKAREAAERRASGADLIERVLGIPVRVDPSLPPAVQLRLDPPYRTPTQAVDAIRAAPSDEDARDVLLQYVRQERGARATPTTEAP